MFDNDSKIEYIYNAAGVKVLKKVYQTTNTPPVITTYRNGFQYTAENLNFFPHAEGYVNVGTNGNFEYIYNYTDHLGNVRVSYKYDETAVNTNNLTIIDANNYYPFGLKHKGYGSPNQTPNYKYKYNGKELQDELGLNWYDYGARNYYAALGRWMNVDPLAEQTMEQYSYVGNNLINMIDPTGMKGEDWIKNDQTGEYIWDNNVTSEYNTPEGFSYVGKENQSIINDLGWNADYNSLTTKKMGRVVLDENSAGITTVTATSNIRVNANVSTQLNLKTGMINKTFNGVDIGVGVKGTGTGTENIGITGFATTTFAGKDYTVGLRDVRFNNSFQITQSNTSNINGDLFIPAKDIYSKSGVKHFPGVNIQRGWINVKSDGSGSVPVSRFLVFPLEYNHTYKPFSPKIN